MILLIFFTILIVYLFMSTRRRPNELPGPFKWPIVGNLPQIAQVNWSRVWHAVDHYAKIYGEIYGMYFGPRYVVVLSDPKVVHELMKRDEWNGRPHDHMAKIKGDGAVLGIIMTDGDLWKETRRFSLRHLRDFGYGRSNMETSVMDEVQNVVDRLDKQIGNEEQVLSFESTFGPAVLSTLWNMVASIRTELDDPDILRLQRIVKETLQRRAFGAGIFWSFQSLRHLFPQGSGFAQQIEGFNILKENMRKVITEHKKTRVPGEPRDFIDAYLEEHENNPENPYFFDEQLVVTCMDLFVAGSDTTTITLRWALLYLILHPEVQKKVQAEIESVVGLDRPVSLADKEKLNYFEAFLLEVNRYSSVAPIVTPHALTETVTYKGYEIPKGALVFINTWGIHRNKDHWGDPDTFRPERFLDKNGKVVTNDEWLLPFGSGKRRCPGEPLAKTSVFLMVSNLLQKFSFSTVPGEPRPSPIPVIGLNLAPLTYRAESRKRKI
ncbi:methyl farnesoate epoxidase [Folsomia candida]|uniref:methyl farnesoate epoxidase n=1 Tax=Folsomia candida TaxID=158441 RepID=UPI000B8FC5E8|nr:methyl farnesoate epoxidase [Folsomia candida]